MVATVACILSLPGAGSGETRHGSGAVGFSVTHDSNLANWHHRVESNWILFQNKVNWSDVIARFCRRETFRRFASSNDAPNISN